MSMELSIIIPVYNEASKIADDIDNAAAFLERQEIRGEIIVADDGSLDQTAAVAEKAASDKACPVRILRLEHRGKGHAVRKGILASAGDRVLFADSGVCVPFDNALRGVELIQRGECDIAHGSRRLRESLIHSNRGLYRRAGSYFFTFLSRWMVGLDAGLTDTQCGFKVYSGEIARRLYAECVTDGFMFDIEVILRARRAGYRIREFPIEWTCDPDTRLSPLRKCREILRELRHIHKSLKNPD